MKKSKWPTMRDIVVKPRNAPDVHIGATVSVSTGRPIVDFRFGDGDADALSPVEARRIANALLRAADCCDAKTAAAKALYSRPLAEEER